MEKLAELIQHSGSGLDPVQAALLIAEADRPQFDRARCEQELARLAEQAREVMDPIKGVYHCAQSLCFLIGEQEGFRGNTDDYYNPDNSYLDAVLDSRTGIPISLALIYIAACRLVDMAIDGVSFPRHFLIALHRRGESGGERVLIDPFEHRIISREECAAKLAPAGPPADQLEHLLQPASGQDICARMLTNLLQIYLGREQFDLALACHQRVALLVPESPALYLELARIYRKMGRSEAAMKALEPLLKHPDENLRNFIAGLIKSLEGDSPPRVH